MSARKRVVLLARPGSACERTVAAIDAAGAELAAIVDPATASEADVRAVAPDAVLVILDHAAENALQTFDGVLGDPSLEVMFDDAEVAAKREGWEAARWARHLAAKLYGHDDVLPPVRSPPESVAETAPQAKTDDVRFQAEMDALQERVAAMPRLSRSAAPAQPKSGAVVIAAGVGGPDAVRQLLAALPASFPRPLLLHQRIDGGQYDKLVRQMQRASQLQVVLAQAGDPLQLGTVHVMPNGVDVIDTPSGLAFAETAGPATFAALPPADSALLLLSGAEMALVDRALSMALSGGMALGQSTENCFDPAASNALVARGGEATAISKLHLKLLLRWPV